MSVRLGDDGLPATFPLPSLMTALVWHDRSDADPGGRYFRQLVLDAVRE